MEVTDVQVRLTTEPESRLKAFCRVTFDSQIVVHDVKVIDTPHGMFVAMPSRRMTARCPGCHGKNYVGARFCNECGGELPFVEPEATAARRHADIVHPINARSRASIERRILEAFEAARRAGPGVADGFDEGDAGA